MERLKVAIADKILELSSLNPDEMKYRLGKIQRFSDFAEACKTLMVKFPQIETELLEMVADDDFDASRASRKVDAVINREEQKQNPSSGDYRAPQIPESIAIITPARAAEPQKVEPLDRVEIVPEEDPIYTQHDDALTETSDVLQETEQREKENLYSQSSEETEAETEEERQLKRNKQVKLFKQIMVALAAIATVILVIFVVKLVIRHWQTVLVVLGSLLAIALLGLYLKKRNKNKSV